MLLLLFYDNYGAVYRVVENRISMFVRDCLELQLRSMSALTIETKPKNDERTVSDTEHRFSKRHLSKLKLKTTWGEHVPYNHVM